MNVYTRQDLSVMQAWPLERKIRVPQAKILETAREHHAEFIALSALMTTTMQRMREIVAAAKQEGITAKIIIGGAVITQEYADEIGADGYSKDAADAVKLAKSLME